MKISKEEIGFREDTKEQLQRLLKKYSESDIFIEAMEIGNLRLAALVVNCKKEEG